MNLCTTDKIKLENIRSVKTKVNKAVKELNKIGCFAVHCKKVYDSRQVQCREIEELYNINIDGLDSYLIVSKITEGKCSTPETLYLLWKGDKNQICGVLKDQGLDVIVPNDEKTTIIINTNLYN